MSLRLSAGPHLSARDNTQSIMRDVLIALLPTTICGLYLFGTRAAWVLGISVVTAVLCEFIWQKLSKKPVRVSDGSAVITGLLLGLTLPSSVPFWLPVVGSAFAILIVKQLFGGLGHNFLNPALAARAVLLTSWPAHMTTYFLPQRLIQPLEASTARIADATASATPLASGASIMDLLWGNVPGSIGEVCKIAILLGFAYLLVRKVIHLGIPVVYIGTTALMAWALGIDPLFAILSGGVLLGAVFMATDYVTSPMLLPGQCLYAVGCGVLTVIIRKYGNYPEGVTYAILIMNILTPLIDRVFKRRVYGEVKQHG